MGGGKSNNDRQRSLIKIGISKNKSTTISIAWCHAVGRAKRKLLLCHGTSVGVPLPFLVNIVTPSALLAITDTNTTTTTTAPTATTKNQKQKGRHDKQYHN